MENINLSMLNKRIERLERQNRILKICAFIGLLIVAAVFVGTKADAEKPKIVAQKFVLVDDKGKECGYLGYDSETKNPRLSLKQCGGSVEQVGLIIDEDSPSLRLDALGLPRTSLTADRERGMSILYLEGQRGSPSGSSGVAKITSGSTATAPQFFLEGREKGRIDIWGSSRQSLRIQDNSSVTRFLINNSNTDSIALRFFDRTGTREIHKVPPTP